MSETFLSTASNGDAREIRLPDEAEVERLAFALAASGAAAGDRTDADLVGAHITDAQRGLVRQFLILSMNSGA